MFTLSNALKGIVIAGSLLAANATPASDVSSDRRQAALQGRTSAADRRGQAIPVESDGVKQAQTQLCSCASATDRGAPAPKR